LSARICRNGCTCLRIVVLAVNLTRMPCRWLAALLLLHGMNCAAAGGWSGSVGLLSDKVVYGLSQSGGDPSAVLDLAWQGDTGWSLNAGVATLGHGAQRPDAELSLGGGVGGAWGDNSAWQLSYLRFETVGSAATRRHGYNQLSLGYGWGEKLQLSVLHTGGFYAPAAGGGRVPSAALITEAVWHQPLARRWALDLGAGRVNYRHASLPDFNYGSIGLSWGVGPVQVFATRIFSNSRASSAAGSRAVVSLLWGF
jgi:hypothetical protein